jgi:hypothetical protein
LSVRNFLSGVESGQHYQAAVDSGAKHMLMSYLYLTKQAPGTLDARKKANPQLNFMIDSGAHTLQLSMNKAPYNTWKIPDFEKYVAAYVKWLRANKHLIFAAVELDVASSLNRCTGRDPNDPFGDTIVDDWREKLFRPLQDEGLDIIYVWHVAQGHQGWENLCANFAYVGLPGEMSKNEDFNVFMSVAKRYTTKVHGFAATKQSDFRDWPWYSIDSTTWKAGEIYGTLPVWDERNQKLRFMSKTDNRAAYREVFEDWGLNADKVINDTDYQMVTRASLKSMTAMEEFYRAKYEKKVFYYRLRLPPPTQIKRVFPLNKVLDAWNLFQPATTFPKHGSISQPARLQEFLTALAAVQYQQLKYITPTGRSFLDTYFPDHLKAQTPDTRRLAKELALMITPGNEAAQRRESFEDYEDSNNPPRFRSEKDRAVLLVADEEVPEFLLLELERLERDAPSWLDEEPPLLQGTPRQAALSAASPK